MSQAGVDFARKLGATMGPFARVVTSVVPRARETAIAESIEQGESDVRARLDVVLVEWERRQTERLARVTEREVERHAQLAMMQLDERLRVAREEAITRLNRELDRAVEMLARNEIAQRLDAR